MYVLNSTLLLLAVLCYLLAACKAQECNNVGELLCGDGRCISYVDYRCDGADDCGDNTDEEGCNTDEQRQECIDNYGYPCSGTGQCLDISYRCDEYPDCPDGDDEEDCQTTDYREKCENVYHGFTCKDTGQCLPIYQRCDSSYDCLDDSDELGCHEEEYREKCRTVYDGFPCSDSGTCLSVYDRCDGTDHCDDGSDEMDCPTPNVKPPTTEKKVVEPPNGVDQPFEGDPERNGKYGETEHKANSVKKRNAGIIGGAVGGVLLVVLIVLIIWALCRTKEDKEVTSAEDNGEEIDDMPSNPDTMEHSALQAKENCYV